MMSSACRTGRVWGVLLVASIGLAPLVASTAESPPRKPLNIVFVQNDSMDGRVCVHGGSGQAAEGRSAISNIQQPISNVEVKRAREEGSQGVSRGLRMGNASERRLSFLLSLDIGYSVFDIGYSAGSFPWFVSSRHSTRLGRFPFPLRPLRLCVRFFCRP